VADARRPSQRWWRYKGPLKVLLAAIGIPLAVAVLWVAWRGGSLRTALASAFFISGAVLVVGAAATGGGARGQVSTIRTGTGPGTTEMQFGAVLIGALVIGLGVLVLWLF
jgi:hypothetical protein